MADHSGEGDYPVFNAQSHIASENLNVAQAPQVAQAPGQPMEAGPAGHPQNAPLGVDEDVEATSAASDTYNMGSDG